jgi:hypothetical protein
VLDALQGGDDARVGIVTFDAAVHFYNVAPGQALPQVRLFLFLR